MKVNVLPAGYHIENFSTLLTAVARQYSDLLSESEITLHRRFAECSYEAKSLYVRLLTRKGPLFRIDKIQYQDIKAPRDALAELQLLNLVRENPPAETEELCHLFTKAELLRLVTVTGASDSELQPQKQLQQLRKPDLIATIDEHFCRDQLSAIITSAYPYVAPAYTEEFETYRICFFGNDRQDLTEFVITDLGHLKYESYPLNKSVRYFTDRKQIENQLAYSRLRQQLLDKSISEDANTLFILANQLPEPNQHPALERRYQNLMNTVARQLERLDAYEQALTLYRRCQQHPSQERQARILKKHAEFEASLALCTELKNSTHPEEKEFALRFIPPLEKALGIASTSATGHSQPLAANHPIIQTDLTLPKSELSVELSTAIALSSPTQDCYYVENTLFCSLFGLLFWDIIFTPIRGAFINAFQRGPLDLFSEHFYRDRKIQIDQRLDQLQSDQWQSTVIHHFETRQGIANYFVNWAVINATLLEHCFTSIPRTHLQKIFQQILQHPGFFSSGFPDLIRFHRTSSPDTRYDLIEVKAPGDKLQANQKRWFQFFAQHQMPAQVLWIKWQDHD